LGESAIEKLIDILDDIRRHDWPVDAELGPTTYNIGTISGGRKPNVVPDFASSEVMFRVVTGLDEVFRMVTEVAGDRAEVKRGFTLPIVRTRTVEEMDIPSSVVRFATDIPCLTNWASRCCSAPARSTTPTPLTNTSPGRIYSTPSKLMLAWRARFCPSDKAPRQRRFAINQLIWS